VPSRTLVSVLSTRLELLTSKLILFSEEVKDRPGDAKPCACMSTFSRKADLPSERKFANPTMSFAYSHHDSVETTNVSFSRIDCHCNDGKWFVYLFLESLRLTGPNQSHMHDP
jgi:hypothetical protein